MNRTKNILAYILIIIGIVVFVYPDILDYKIKSETDQVIENLQEVFDSEDTFVTDSKELNEKPKHIEGISEAVYKDRDKVYMDMKNYNEDLYKNGQKLLDAWSYTQAPVDLGSVADDSGAIGYIQIPDMDEELPLYIGASTENMAKGAAVMGQTSMPIGGENTNSVIVGHRGYSGAPYFREIERLKEGSKVYVTTPWEKLTYRVTEIAIINPDDAESIMIREGRDMITLLTCHPYMSHGKFRYVVFCERTANDKEDVEETASETTVNIETKEELPETELMLSSDVSFHSSEAMIEIERTIRYIAVICLILFAIIYTVINKKKK